jgi:uncharacterized protein YndB with AHSA1/START domain
MPWQLTRSIAASTEHVFRTVADPVEFQRAVGANPDVQFLVPDRMAVGSRFRAFRMTNGKEMAFEQEVTQFTPGRLVRMVNVTHGVVWDSTFEVEPNTSGSLLTCTMTAATRNPIKRLVMFLVSGKVRQALAKDMDAVKSYAERSPDSGQQDGHG